jgi:hypothetical protein
MTKSTNLTWERNTNTGNHHAVDDLGITVFTAVKSSGRFWLHWGANRSQEARIMRGTLKECKEHAQEEHESMLDVEHLTQPETGWKTEEDESPEFTPEQVKDLARDDDYYTDPDFPVNGTPVLNQEPKTETVETPEPDIHEWKTEEGARRHFLLTYDIPSDSTVPNPSVRLRWFAIRVNLSCWVVPEFMMTRPEYEEIVNEFADNDINYHTIRFDLAEEEKIRTIAVQALEKETADIHGSLIKSLDDATAAYELARESSPLFTEEEEGDALKAKHKRAGLALRRAEERLNAAVEAAKKFDETMELVDLFDGLRKAISAENAAHVAEVEERQRRFPDADRTVGFRRSGPQEKLFGRSLASVLRWMGSEGWEFEQARSVVVDRMRKRLSPGTIRVQLSNGKTGKRGEIADLSEDEREELESYLSN